MNVDGVAVGSKTEPPSSEPVSFIPVKVADDGAAPVKTWLNPLGIYDQPTMQWLQGQGPPEQESKQPDPQTDRESALLKAKVEEFNRRVRETPHDIQLWMAFVAFQVSVAAPVHLPEWLSQLGESGFALVRFSSPWEESWRGAFENG